jgi:hypothetical protein
MAQTNIINCKVKLPGTQLFHDAYVHEKNKGARMDSETSLTLSLLMSCIYIYMCVCVCVAPSKARNLTSYIYGRDFYWGFCFLNREFR